MIVYVIIKMKDHSQLIYPTAAGSYQYIFPFIYLLTFIGAIQCFHEQPLSQGVICNIRVQLYQAMIINLYSPSYLIFFYFILMNFLTKIPRASLLNYIRASFSSDNWKDRDQSAEKVYISSEEKKTLSKLLHKIDESQNNATEKEVTFQRELKALLKKHHITSVAFEAEVNNLHKHLKITPYIARKYRITNVIVEQH